jgi:hypothetical protein
MFYYIWYIPKQRAFKELLKRTVCKIYFSWVEDQWIKNNLNNFSAKWIFTLICSDLWLEFFVLAAGPNCNSGIGRISFDRKPKTGNLAWKGRDLCVIHLQDKVTPSTKALWPGASFQNRSYWECSSLFWIREDTFLTTKALWPGASFQNRSY